MRSDPRDHAEPDALARVRHELDEARDEGRAVAGDLTDRQLWWRPGPDRWSVAECLDHLVLTGEAYLRVLDEALSSARREGRTAEGPFRRGLVGRWVIRGLEPPPGFALPAPRSIRPRRPVPGGAGRPAKENGPRGAEASDAGSPSSPEAGGSSGASIAGPSGGRTATGSSPSGAGAPSSPLPRFLALQDRLEERVDDARGIDLGAVKVTSPFVPILKVDLLSAFGVVTAHQRRHLWQARQVRQEKGWPGAS